MSGWCVLPILLKQLCLYLCLRFLLFPAACYHAEQCGNYSEWGRDLWLTGLIILFTVVKNSMKNISNVCVCFLVIFSETDNILADYYKYKHFSQPWFCPRSFVHTLNRCFKSHRNPAFKLRPLQCIPPPENYFLIRLQWHVRGIEVACLIHFPNWGLVVNFPHKDTGRQPPQWFTSCFFWATHG